MARALSALIEKLRSKKTTVAAVFAMGIKGAGALLTILIFTLAARVVSADEFGRLAVWFNAALLLAVAACFGQDTLIARSWGEYSGRGDHEMARGAYWFGWRMTLLSVAVFVAGLLFFAPRVGASLAPAALYAVASFMFAQTVLHYSSHSSRVLVGIAVSEAGRELIWRFVLLIAVIWAILHQGLTMTEFFYAGAVGMMLSVAFQAVAVRRKFEREPVASTRESERPQWFRRGRDMWLSAVVEAVSGYADVMLVGYFAGPAAAGDYFVAARIANIFLMVQTGLNTYSFSHSANLYFSGQIERLQDILRSTVSVSVAIAAPCLAIILVFGQPILTIFGERYGADYPILVVLATGAFLMALSGSSSVILLTTGQEQLYSRVVLVATLVRMALTALLGMYFGAFGAACGWAVVNAPLAMWLAHICRKGSHVDPSIMSVLRHLLAPAAAPDAQRSAPV